MFPETLSLDSHALDFDWTPVVTGVRFTLPFLIAYVVLACVQVFPLRTATVRRKIADARAVSLQVAVVFLLGFSFEVIVTPLVADQRMMLWIVTRAGVLIALQIALASWWISTSDRRALRKLVG